MTATVEIDPWLKEMYEDLAGVEAGYGPFLSNAIAKWLDVPDLSYIREIHKEVYPEGVYPEGGKARTTTRRRGSS